MTAFWALPYGGPNFPANDQLFYSLMSAISIDTNQTLFHTPGDDVLVSGSGPFSLMPGDSTSFVMAVFLSENYQDMIDDANYIADSNHVTGVAPEETIAAYRLFNNYPNPFNPTTTIRYDLPEPAKVSLIVYDVLGRKVAELVNEEKAAGYHSITWNAANVASGVYLARFTAFDANGYSKYSRVNKLILMK